LLAYNLLERNKKWNKSVTNAGGWADSDLNKYLNHRLYNAMPNQFKELLKKVIVYSSIGQMSTELSSSDCYITIPSLIEVDPTKTFEPYNSEGTSISYMNTNESRMRSRIGREPSEYWLRSPNAAYSNYVYTIDEFGKPHTTVNATGSFGILIEISL
jgi:hypothetical protein